MLARGAIEDIVAVIVPAFVPDCGLRVSQITLLLARIGCRMSAQRLPKSHLRYSANSYRFGSFWKYATMRSTEAAWRYALQKIERLNQRNHHFHAGFRLKKPITILRCDS
jgi:hypothetical protein